MNTRHLVRSCSILAGSLLLGVSLAHAADGTWLGNSGNWSKSGTWSNSVVANGAGSRQTVTYDLHG